MMLNLKLKGKKGNSSIEYAFLIALVIGALIGMQAYLKGSVCQRWRQAGDAFGFGRQYASSDSPQDSLQDPPEDFVFAPMKIDGYVVDDYGNHQDFSERLTWESISLTEEQWTDLIDYDTKRLRIPWNAAEKWFSDNLGIDYNDTLSLLGISDVSDEKMAVALTIRLGEFGSSLFTRFHIRVNY